MKSWRRRSLAILLILGACASVPPSTPPSPPSRPSTVSDATAGHAATRAMSMVGKPYRYAGNTPAGFDCSGLVQYSYAQVAVKVPRDTQLLRRRGKVVSGDDMRRGDLVFFDQEGEQTSHVGIYLGYKRFVHAPSKGGRVRTDSLDGTYWKKHFVEARRL